MATELRSGEREIGILFVDLVDSSIFASTLSVQAYAQYVDDFKKIALTQCGFFFDQYLGGKYESGRDYQAQIIGDELVVFLSSGRPGNDVYQLTVLAALLKAAWLGSDFNRDLLRRGLPPSDVAAGINHGMVWAEWQDNAFRYTGYSINLAKRIESRSRTGQRYGIFVSDRACKLINRKVRNLLFGERQFFEAKGILGTVAVAELAHCFFSPVERLSPALAAGLEAVLVSAIRVAGKDSWIHDFVQNWSESAHGRVTDEAMELCRQVLHYDPANPLALYYLAQGFSERKESALALLTYEDLLRSSPNFGDAHWECGKLLASLGRTDEAANSLRRALKLGVEDAAADLTALTTTNSGNPQKPA